MKKSFLVLASLVFAIIGCNQNPDILTHKDVSGGFTFDYPAADWSIKVEYSLDGEPSNPDDGITQAAFKDTSVILFHPVKDTAAQNPKDSVYLIANLKFPGSTVIDEKPFTVHGITEVTTKLDKEEYKWLTLELPNNSSYLVMEILDPINPPYPAGFESGVEMIISTVKEL